MKIAKISLDLDSFMSISGKMLTKGTSKIKIRVSLKLRIEKEKVWFKESQRERSSKPKIK
jgi:hypothetical protein